MNLIGLILVISIIINNKLISAEYDACLETARVYEDPAVNLSTSLFLVDELTFGTTSFKTKTINLFEIRSLHCNFRPIHTMKLNSDELPITAASDKSYIYVLVKYILKNKIIKLELINTKNKSLELVRVKEVELKFRPTGISYFDKHIYLIGNLNNVISVLNTSLNDVYMYRGNRTYEERVTYAKYPDYSLYNLNLAIDQNVGFFGVFRLFDSQGVYLFRHFKSYFTHLRGLESRFYEFQKAKCVEDITIVPINETSSYIFMTDSCQDYVKTFIYHKATSSETEKLYVNYFISVKSSPLSVVVHPAGYFILLICDDVLNPTWTRLKVFNLNDCGLDFHMKPNAYPNKFSKIESIIKYFNNTLNVLV